MTMNRDSILCIGEAVWDLYPDKPRLGGAPLNVAVHLARQRVQTHLLTAVGRDELGQQCLSFLEHEGIPGVLCHPRLPTGTVRVEIDPYGVPRFTIHDHSAWTDIDGAFLSGIPPLPEWVELDTISVIVFGCLAMHCPENRRLADRLFSAFTQGGLPLPIRLCDMNLRPGWSDPEVVEWCIARTEILKVSEEERRFLACRNALASSEGDRALMLRHDLRGLCITMGPQGLRWVDSSTPDTLQMPVHSDPCAPPVVDTTGAGDALTASIALGLSRKETPQAFLERGGKWAARVCQLPGALPPPAFDLEPS